MKSLVIGKGQIGQALLEIFSRTHECYVRDVMPQIDDPKNVEVLHIAFPYTENFVENVREYIAIYRPKLTIIHSSVPVGTTEQCGDHVVHSPERGRFPNLTKEMMTFSKFIGGSEIEDLNLAKRYFDKCHWNTILIGDSKWTELVKLLSNIHLGLEIAWRQEVDRIAESFELGGQAVYNIWEDSYNKGYAKLGHKHLIRPTVRPDPIGGHCILPCVDILATQFDSEAFQFIRRSNAKREAKERSKRSDGSVGKAVLEVQS